MTMLLFARTTVVLVSLVCSGCSLGADRDLVRNRTESLFRTGFPGDGVFGQVPPVSVPVTDELYARPDLDLYLRYGLHHNGALRNAYEQWRAALERIPQVTALPDPVFTFAQYVEEVQTRTGPQQRRYALSQSFPWFGKIGLRGAVASGAAEQRWQQVRAARLQVIREIQVAYHEYGYLAQSTRITLEVLELLRQLEPSVQRRIAGGTGGQQDLLRLQVEIGRVENELSSRQQVRRAISARLAAAMNMPERKLLPLPTLTEPVLRTVDTDSLLSRAQSLSPVLLELAERERTNSHARDLAGLDKWPDLTVGVDYFETGDALTPVPGSGDDPWALRVMFNLPIGRTRYAAAEREAERKVAAVRYQLADRQAKLRSEVEHAVFQRDDAARQVVLYRDSLLPRAREALEVTRSAYRAGAAPLLDLIDSERALLEFETGYWRACRDQHQSQARVSELVGGEVR